MKWRRVWKDRVRKKRGWRSRYKKLSKEKLFRTGALAALIGVIASIFIFAILFAWYARDLPDPDKIVRREGFSTKILARDGELLYDVFGDQRRTPVPLEEIPEDLKNATIAIEDKNFYKHGGFDPKGITRAFFTILFRGRLAGGSTLTQQLVKNGLLTSERRISRKIKEFVLAVQIENKFNKDEILQMYLNEVPYGGTAWGIQAAAETYFGKDVNELGLIESAILSGMPQRPSAYSPYGTNPKAYVRRTTDVLRRMREDDYISKDQEKEAVAKLEDVEFELPSTGIKAPHFVLYVKEQLEEMYGERLVEQGGLKVTTTLNWDLHEIAQEIVAEEIAKVEDVDITNGAAVVLDPNNGQVLSMVGSKDYFDEDYDGQVNVTMSLRQPGSAIKPVTYVTAFKEGYTPAQMLMDVSTVFPHQGEKDYQPVNYDGKFRGPVQLRFALGSSLNVVSVKLLAMVGIKDMLSTAYDMGLTTLEPTRDNLKRFGLSVTLGGGEVRLIELTSAYSAFANGGLKVEPVTILKVEDKDGKVLFEHKDVKGKRALNEGVTYLINHVLSDNNARLLTFGANSYLNMGGRPIAVKTGTTNDKRDNWAVGWSRSAAVGVWVGNNDNSPMKQVASGVSGASPIWRRIMLTTLNQGYQDDPFAIPSNVEARLVDTISGYPEHDGYSTRSEYIVKGTLPGLPDPVHARLKLCRGQNKLASDLDVSRGEYDEKEFYVFAEDDPISTDGRNRWLEGINAWLSGQGDEKYRPPTEYCDSADEVAVRVNQPKDRENFSGNKIPIEIEVFTQEDLESVAIYVDGELNTSYSSKKVNDTINLLDGKYTLKVKAKRKDGKSGESGDIKIGEETIFLRIGAMLRSFRDFLGFL